MWTMLVEEYIDKIIHAKIHDILLGLAHYTYIYLWERIIPL